MSTPTGWPSAGPGAASRISRAGPAPTRPRTTRTAGPSPSWACRPFPTASPASPSTTVPSASSTGRTSSDPSKRATTFRARYGTELAPPRTWAEFARIADFFDRPDEGLHGTLFALYPDGHNNVFDFALQVLSRGGSLEQEGRVVLDSPEALDALQDYRSLINSPFIHPQSRELESIGACWTFARGEVAMMVNWFGFATMCETVEGSRVRGCVDVSAIPHADSHPDPVSLNVYYVWSISRDSQHKDLAYEYIKHCVSKENDVILTLEGGIGCRRSTWFDPRVNQAIPYYSRMEEIHGYASTLPRTTAWHPISTVIDQMVIDTIDTDAGRRILRRRRPGGRDRGQDGPAVEPRDRDAMIAWAPRGSRRRRGLPRFGRPTSRQSSRPADSQDRGAREELPRVARAGHAHEVVA